MNSSPADCIAEKAPTEALRTIHDPEVVDLVRDLQKRAKRPIVLVTGPSGVGKSTLVESGLSSRLRRLSNRFRHSTISVKIDDTATSLTDQCIREIWSHHPNLNRHIATRSSVARKQRAQLLELATSDPVQAGKQLFAILRGLEKGTTSKLRDVRFMLHIDGLERLYENRVGETDNPFVPVFGPAADPFGFLREIMEANSILVVLGYRDWVRESVRKALVRSKISNNNTLRYAIDWPTETRISSVINRTISESKIAGEGLNASEIAAKLTRDFSQASPACAQHLHRVLAVAGAENELDGYLNNTAENYYQSLPDEIQGGVARIVQRFSGGKQTLAAREVSNDPHLWSVANKMADSGLLCLSGRSLDTAEFSLVSNDIFKSWDRARKWDTESSSATTFAAVHQTDQFENHALSWKSTDRDPDLLLHVDQSLDRAMELLTQHRDEPILSPLAKEFLEASVEASKHRIRGRKMMRQLGYPAVAALVIVGLIVFSVSHFSGNSKAPAVDLPPESTDTTDGLASSPKVAIQTPISTTGAITAPAAPVPEPATAETPVHRESAQPEPALAPELMNLAAQITGSKPPKPAAKPIEVAEPRPEIKKVPTHSIPEGLTADSTAAEITTSIETHLSNRKLDSALDSIYYLFARSESQAKKIRLNASELRRLTVSLGKIVMLQGDQKGSKLGWKIGLANHSRSVEAIPSDIRLLMARVVSNANRPDEMTAVLFGSENVESPTLREAATAVLELEFNSETSTPNEIPPFDSALISSLPVSDSVKSKLRANN